VKAGNASVTSCDVDRVTLAIIFLALARGREHARIRSGNVIESRLHLPGDVTVKRSRASTFFAVRNA
jgi:hypothetical protein